MFTSELDPSISVIIWMTVKVRSHQMRMKRINRAWRLNLLASFAREVHYTTDANSCHGRGFCPAAPVSLLNGWHGFCWEGSCALYVLWKAEKWRRLIRRRVWVHQTLQKRTQLGEFHFSLSSKQDPFYSCFCKSTKMYIQLRVSTYNHDYFVLHCCLGFSASARNHVTARASSWLVNAARISAKVQIFQLKRPKRSIRANSAAGLSIASLLWLNMYIICV